MTDEEARGAQNGVSHAAAAGRTITGTNGSDKLTGTAGDDVIDGRGGYDQITGGGGADRMTGGFSKDAFRGTVADFDGDTITDFAGDRIVVLGADLGAANLSTSIDGSGTTLRIDADRDGTTDASIRLEGLSGGSFKADAKGGYTIVTHDADGATSPPSPPPPSPPPASGGGGRTITGTSGSDKLIGTAGDDVIDGRGGYDQITGGGGADRMTGGASKDAFRGTVADFDGDTITDFANDRIVVLGQDLSSANLSTISDAGGTTLRIDANRDGTADASIRLEGLSGGSFKADAKGGYTILTHDADGSTSPPPSPPPPSPPPPTGGGGTGRTITGTDAGEKLVGTAGDDVIDGRGGYDQITGGGGADRMTGGASTDAFRGTIAEFDGDTITDFAGDRIVVLGQDLASGNLSTRSDAGGTTLRIDADRDGTADASIRLEGLFGGSFKAEAKGGYTIVTHDATGGGGGGGDTPDLMIIGDSFTITSRQFPQKLDAALDRDGYDVDVIAFSKSGDTAGQARARLEGYFADADNEMPEAAIVMLGINDALQQKSFAETKADLAGIVDLFQANDVDVLLARPDSFFPLRSNSSDKGFADADDQRAFARIFDQLAASEKIPLEPAFTDGLAEPDTDPALLEGDGFHPNPRGSAVMVENVLPEVESLLDGLSAPSGMSVATALVDDGIF